MLEGKKIIFLIAGGLVLLVVILLIFLMLFLRRAGPVTITYWGIWEPEAVYSTAIAEYKKNHPNVTIKYMKQSTINYRDRLATALSQNDGPDIARIHNSWVSSFKTILAPIPFDQSVFYPVARDLYPYAIPLEIDTLALYVNDDILRAGGVNVPTIWDGDDGFLATARKLTVRDANGRIKTAGAAMGTASNVDHWQEIVGLMMFQTGVDMAREANSEAAASALSYYMAFSTSERIWDETLDNSTLAFAQGKVGMYFGPSWRYFDIKAINPNLNFHITSAPQLVGADTVNYASYWAEAVSAKSKNKTIAFDFLKFLSSKEQMAKLYEAQSKIREFGEPYSRTDMASLLESDPNVGPFIKAAPTAKAWYLASFTSDTTGASGRINNYYAEAINAMLRGSDARSALSTVASGISQVLGK